MTWLLMLIQNYFQDIPIDIKNAFLAAEDDGFFNLLEDLIR